MFSNLQRARLHRCNTQHDYAWASESLGTWEPFAWKPNATWKLYSASILSARSWCARHRNSPLKVMKPSFYIFFYTFICRWCGEPVRKLTGSAVRITFQSEFSPFIPCMMPQLLPCTETSWKHSLVGTNVLCDKDQGVFSWVQLQKTKQPPEQRFKDNWTCIKEKVWVKNGGANRSRWEVEVFHYNVLEKAEISAAGRESLTGICKCHCLSAVLLRAAAVVILQQPPKSSWHGVKPSHISSVTWIVFVA